MHVTHFHHGVGRRTALCHRRTIYFRKQKDLVGPGIQPLAWQPLYNLGILPAEVQEENVLCGIWGVLNQLRMFKEGKCKFLPLFSGGGYQSASFHRS